MKSDHVHHYPRLPYAANGPRFRPPFLLTKPLRESGQADALADWRGQRAIGVVYHPEYEAGNYVPTNLASRYDAYIHIDRTQAVKPLAIEPTWTPVALDQTYPTGY